MKNIQIIAFAAIFIALVYHYGMGFVAFFIALSFMIFFHEFGHFLAARFFGVCVEKFSVGFGKAIVEKKVGSTIYQIASIPLGGFVQLKGQNDADPKATSNDPDSYTQICPLKRIAILFAGPFFNIILAFFIYIAIGFLGVAKTAPVVGEVANLQINGQKIKSPAQIAGLKKGDEIIAINGKQITTWDEISPALIRGIKNQITIKRDKKEQILNLEPIFADSLNEFMQPIKKPMIGVAPSFETIKIYHSGISSIKFAWEQTIWATGITYRALYKMIAGQISPKNMSGIVMMTDVMSRAYAINFGVFLVIAAVISVNLGVFNLLPVPVLDGGHIVFNIYEMIFRRKMPEKVFVALSYGGMAVLGALMLFTIYNDIFNHLNLQ